MIAFAAGAADGTWSAASTSTGAPQLLVLQTTGAVLTGSMDGIAFSGGKVQGTAVWFNTVRAGVAYSYKGTVAGNQLDLHETRADGSGHRALTFNRN